MGGAGLTQKLAYPVAYNHRLLILHLVGGVPVSLVVRLFVCLFFCTVPVGFSHLFSSASMCVSFSSHARHTVTMSGSLGEGGREGVNVNRSNRRRTFRETKLSTDGDTWRNQFDAWLRIARLSNMMKQTESLTPRERPAHNQSIQECPEINSR